MRNNALAILLTLSIYCFGIAQTFSAKVLDYKTKTPIEIASVYFDNTTIGTTTNAKGEFSISYTDAIQSALIISYLGYKTETIVDYRQKTNDIIYLKPINNILEEVLITADDGLTRRQKLRIFRKQFLGFTRFAQSCKILNEDDLILRYDKKQKQLTAHAINPILIRNKGLQYFVSFDIKSFKIKFNYVEERNSVYEIKSVQYSGNTFYKNLKKFNKKKAEKNRKKAFNGSVLQFMRALYNKKLENKGYTVFFKSFKVNPWNHFKIESVENSSKKQVSLKNPVSILYDKKQQSKISFLNPHILIDNYGNYSGVASVMFSGYMGNQRVGDLLPNDYGLID